jgi:hypothetical protein
MLPEWSWVLVRDIVNSTEHFHATQMSAPDDCTQGGNTHH